MRTRRPWTPTSRTKVALAGGRAAPGRRAIAFDRADVIMHRRPSAHPQRRELHGVRRRPARSSAEHLLPWAAKVHGGQLQEQRRQDRGGHAVKYPFSTGDELLAICEAGHLPSPR
ncbi:hypothetical protein QJS66_15005 [Kocuria rhizophila]|nr:hypothetical protein QJS66_15005 [Kocuria rhizophila]